jgi:hypothetical protein
VGRRSMADVSQSADEHRPSMPLEQARAVFVTAPFTRLARTHVFSVGGDALFTMGLAGTVFFASPDLSAARVNTALTLVLTIAPFAVVGPMLSPLLDRMHGGRRWMIFSACAVRATLAFLLVQNLDNIAFYPLAFCMLVAGKSYQIAKSALVPTTVRNDKELVEANSKLSLLSGISVVVAGIPGGLLWWLGGPDWVLGLAVVFFVTGATLALRLPATKVAVDPPDEVERQELRGAAILLAASAMGSLRGIVGFLAFLLAFSFREGQQLWLGVVAVCAQAGFLVGAAIAPRLRQKIEEELILTGVLCTVALTALGAALTGGIVVASVMSFTVGLSASAGKQAFDALVQRDAPDVNRGRSFARFETRFQLLWVIGALIPVAVTIPNQLGFVVIAAVAAFAGGSYWMGLRSATSRASVLVRRLRRQQRADDELVLARDLGFASALDETPAGGTPRGRSAAARAAARRRRAGTGGADVGRGNDGATPDVAGGESSSMPDGRPGADRDSAGDGAGLSGGADAADMADPELFPPDEQGPDLDWHPEY